MLLSKSKIENETFFLHMVAQLKRHQFEDFLSSHGGTIKKTPI